MIGLRYRAALGVAVAVLAAPGCGIAAEVAPAPAKPSLQDLFNTASETAESGHCDKAIPMFEALLVDPRVKPGSLPAAAISVRHGRCLLERGDEETGTVLILAGLPKLEVSGEGFADEIASTNTLLGQAAFRRFDYDAAVTWFTRAAAAKDRNLRLRAMMRLAQVKLFDGDGAALQIIGKAITELGDKTPQEKDTHANFLAVRGRALMNMGRNKEAAADLRRALSLSGGLTLKTTLSDVALRGDLAQAMLLLGQRDEARKYLAYTGAGRIEESPFNSATFMGVPSCTGEPGLRPEDSAVVEFAIGDDGQVSVAQTVYSRGTFAAATAFAHAVRDWTWKPESIAKLPAFYRNLTRVELHCSNASGEVGHVTTPLYNRITSWAAPIAGLGETEMQTPFVPGEAAPSSDANSVRIPRKTVVERLRARGAERAAAGDKRAAGAALALAALFDPIRTDRSRQDMAQAIVLIGEADPRRTDPGSAAAIASLRAFEAMDISTNSSLSGRKGLQQIETVLRPVLDEPLIAADALAQDTLRTYFATRRRVGELGPEQTALLRAVADDSRLEEGHPLRQIALLRLASVAAVAKQYQEAQALFTRTGLTEQQCSLIGDVPKLKASGATSSDFPDEALYMGFEGWVKVEYDIDAAGHTANQRALIAYPPFVFVDAARNIARGVRYDPTYRPSGQLACSATSETVRFLNH